MSNRNVKNITSRLDFCYANNDTLKRGLTYKQILHAMENLIAGPSSAVSAVQALKLESLTPYLSEYIPSLIKFMLKITILL